MEGADVLNVGGGSASKWVWRSPWVSASGESRGRWKGHLRLSYRALSHKPDLAKEGTTSSYPLLAEYSKDILQLIHAGIYLFQENICYLQEQNSLI